MPAETIGPGVRENPQACHLDTNVPPGACLPMASSLESTWRSLWAAWPAPFPIWVYSVLTQLTINPTVTGCRD